MEQKVKWPALGLIATACLGALLALYTIAMAALGHAQNTAQWPEQMKWMANPAYSMVSSIVSLGVCGFLVWAGLQMMALKNRTISLVACIVAMIPCFACCCTGLPVGIWGIIVLMNEEVKAAFKS